VATARDADGRQIELRTWRGESSQPDTTRWLYDRAGMVTNKVYADGLGPSYAYLADGRLTARIWARGVTTAYGYSDDSGGRIQTTLYSDSTPSMTNRYDLAGRLIAVTDGTGTRTYAYNALGRLAAETNALAVIERRYDALGRDAGYDLAIPGYSADTFAVRCDYDAYGRLDGVTSILGGVTNVFRYSYLEGSAILSGMTNGCGVGWSRTYESHRDLVAAVSNHTDVLPVSTFVYTNDAAGRRIRRVDDGVSTNMFAYNRRSEVTGAVMGARAHSYGYDGLGNRLGATNDGVATLYRANLLNQYTNILRASAPPRETSPAYDPDGSMVANGAWSYTWDAENRLIGVASNGIPVFTNAYDYMNRRVTKTTATRVAHFIWDGWNIVAEIVVDRQTVATNRTRYVWGLDLSGALQGAGGVGGLLAVIRPEGSFYPCYDANGNVTDYVNAAGTVVAHYEYSPFGEITAQSGILADTFVFRFSTKYHDAETGVVMYQLRPYSPTLGRWLCRDPIQEQGGVNLYLSVDNSPIDVADPLGLHTINNAWAYLINHGIAPAIPAYFDPITQQWFPGQYSDQQLFNAWVALEQADTGWLSTISDCPDNIRIVNGQPQNCDQSQWKSFGAANQTFHPGASWCMRSNTSSGPGQQCCYDSHGDLITSGLGAGTPDRQAASFWNGLYLNHYFHDVAPFNIAWQLDGGILGSHLRAYLAVRPPSQGGGSCCK
jgi:RHS repeat-associated protein